MKTGFGLLLFCLALPCAAQVSAPVAAPQPATVPTVAAPQAAPVAGPQSAPRAAPEAAGPESARAGEPEVKRTVSEGKTTRIEELRVRGVVQRIVVTSKGADGTSYEIITGDGSRDLGDGANTSRGAAGRRVWRVLDF